MHAIGNALSVRKTSRRSRSEMHYLWSVWIECYFFRSRVSVIDSFRIEMCTQNTAGQKFKDLVVCFPIFALKGSKTQKFTVSGVTLHYTE